MIQQQAVLHSAAMGARGSRERAREAQTLVAREHMYGQFDTVIVAGGSRLPCHREVLMEHSAYFRSMFSKFKEKDVACVELKDIQDPRVMSQVKLLCKSPNVSNQFLLR